MRKRSFPFQPLEVPDSEEEDDFYGKTTIPDELDAWVKREVGCFGRRMASERASKRRSTESVFFR